MRRRGVDLHLLPNGLTADTKAGARPSRSADEKLRQRVDCFACLMNW